MSQELKLRRGTALEHETFTGANGEVTIDTTNDDARVHDGETPGGHSAAQASVYSHLKSLLNAPKKNGAVYKVISFYDGWAALADPLLIDGDFVFNSSIEKSSHDGGKIIAPEALAAWDGNPINLNVLLEWSGSGTGCFVRMFDNYPTARDYGAVRADPTFDNSIPFQHYIDLYDVLIIDDLVGSYHMHNSCTFGNSFKLIGSFPQNNDNGLATCQIVISSDTWDMAEGFIFKKADREFQSQGFQCVNVTFRGFGNAGFPDLKAMTDVGIHAFDITGIKEGVDFKNSHVRNLTGLCYEDQTASTYLGHVTMDNCHFFSCYKIYDISPTTGHKMVNCRVYECRDWGTTSDVVVYGGSYQSGSIGINDGGIHANRIHCIGVWFEGGNRYLDAPYAVAEQCRFSAAKEDGEPRLAAVTGFFTDDITGEYYGYYEFKGCSFNTQTRIYGGPSNLDAKELYISCESCSGLNLFGSGYTSIQNALAAGVRYSGRNNDVVTQPEYYNRSFRNQPTGFDGGVMLTQRQFTGNTSFTVNRKRIANSNYTTYGSDFVKLYFNGNNGSSGGARYAEIVLMRTYDDIWEANVINEIGGTSLITVTLSNLTNVSVDVTVTVNYSGDLSDSKLFIGALSENLQIEDFSNVTLY